MNSTPGATHSSKPSGYGFHCVLPKQDFALGCLPSPTSGCVRGAEDGGLVVGIVDPVAVVQMTSNPEVAAVAQEVRIRLERVRAALGTANTGSQDSHVS